MLYFTGLFHGNDIVVNGLSAGEDHDLRVGADVLEDLCGLLGLLLGDILAEVQGDEGGRALLRVGGQLIQQNIQLIIGAEQLALFQKSELRAA